MEKQLRNSSIELMRLVLMLMIVVHHGIVHGIGLSSLGWGSASFQLNATFQGGNMIPLFAVNSLCICAVNCFVMISGYYGIKPATKKVLVLLSAVTFYTLLFTTPYYITNKDYANGLFSLLILSHSKYWFVVDYLFLMAFAPLFNKFHGKKLIVLMLFISCYMGFLWKFQANENGYTLFQFFTIYCLGRYLKDHKVAICKWTGFSLYLGGAVLTAVLCFGLYEMNLDKFAWRMTYYNNPLIIVSTIGLFFFFKGMNFQSRKVNLIAKSAFGIYLFQCAEGIRVFYYNTIHEISEGNGVLLTMMSVLLFALGIVIMAVAVDFVQRFISDKVVSYIVQRFPKLNNLSV